MKKGTSKIAIEAIKKYKNIIIFHHVRPDGDCLGSQAGLAQLIRDNFQNKKVYTPGDNVHTFDFMGYKYNDIDEIDFSDSLAIVVDASSSDRIQNKELLLEKKCNKTLRIDHHPNGSDIEYDYLWVDAHYVAAAEMVAKIAKDAKWKISQEAAKHIFLGIVTDSGRFLYPDTSARTFDLVSFLMKKSKFNPFEIYQQLNKRTMQDIKYVGEILNNFEQKGRVLYYKVTQEKMSKFNFNSLKAASFVNELANIENNSIWAFFIELPEGGIRCRLRSNGPLVNEVARNHFGGGHDNAAGCTIKDWSELDSLLEELNNKIGEYEKNENRNI